jgi:glutamate formiminotransferase/formiminotetrahydrofolate cyclodeaminase
MLNKQPLSVFLDELASDSPAPGGGSVAALAGSLGTALAAMVCRLTIGKKKYLDVAEDMKHALQQLEDHRKTFTALIESDTNAFNKVMEAFTLPKESEDQRVVRTAAIQEATKEAALVPLEVMKHVIDTLAIVKLVAEKGNINSISDAGVSALMLTAACEGASLNVQINLNSITDSEFVGWREEEIKSLTRTGRLQADDILSTVRRKISTKK